MASARFKLVKWINIGLWTGALAYLLLAIRAVTAGGWQPFAIFLVCSAVHAFAAMLPPNYVRTGQRA